MIVSGFSLHKCEHEHRFQSTLRKIESAERAQQLIESWSDVVFITLDTPSPKLTVRREFITECEESGASLIAYALVESNEIIWLRSRIENSGFAKLIINSLDSDVMPSEITEESVGFWFHFLIDRVFDELFFDRMITQLNTLPNLRPLSLLLKGEQIKAKGAIEVLFTLIHHHSLNGFRDICLRWQDTDLFILIDQSNQKHKLFFDISHYRFMSSFYDDEKAYIEEHATDQTWLIHFHSSEKTTRRVHKTCFDMLVYE